MFSIEFLHQIRRHELAFVERHLPTRVRILEIGGGTGFQAKLLSEHGYDVASIDVPTLDEDLFRFEPPPGIAVHEVAP